VLSASNRIADRLSASLDNPGHDETSLPSANIKLEINGGKSRLMHFLKGSREHLPHSGARFGVLTAQNAKQRLALFGICSLIEDDEGLAFALVNRPRP